jgi:class 3 adenylate cyclase
VPPDRLVEILNSRLQLVTSAIQAHGGTLDKFMGDGVIALFNAPAPQPDHALRAVHAGLDMVAAFKTIADLDRRLSVGIGINTGDVLVGNIGTPQLMNYTAVGDAVNLAQRLQEMAGEDEVLIGPRTFELAQRQVNVEPLGVRQVRGRSEQITVYRVLGACPQQPTLLPGDEVAIVEQASFT